MFNLRIRLLLFFFSSAALFQSTGASGSPDSKEDITSPEFDRPVLRDGAFDKLAKREREKQERAAEEIDKARRAEKEKKDKEDKDKQFDGSEFKVRRFGEPEFDKRSYNDKEEERTHAAEDIDKTPRGDERSARRDETDKSNESEKMRREKEGVKASDDKDEREDPRLIGVNLGERTGPIHELPGDWVPDKIDETNNGGFGVIPDSGAPVPYRLNGHVDIQRGRPWEIKE